MVEHLAGVLHKNKGYHQRQTFRYCADNYDDSDRYTFNKLAYDITDSPVLCYIEENRGTLAKYLTGIGSYICKENEIDHVNDSYNDSRDITEYGDLLSKLGKLYLQR